MLNAPHSVAKKELGANALGIRAVAELWSDEDLALSDRSSVVVIPARPLLEWLQTQLGGPNRDEIARALFDLVDGVSVHQLIAFTGLSEDRCAEILRIGLSAHKET